MTENCEQYCWKVEHVWIPVFPAIFPERVAGNLLSVDGSATQLPAILLAILLGVDAPLDFGRWYGIFYQNFLISAFPLR